MRQGECIEEIWHECHGLKAVEWGWLKLRSQRGYMSRRHCKVFTSPAENGSLTWKAVLLACSELVTDLSTEPLWRRLILPLYLYLHFKNVLLGVTMWSPYKIPEHWENAVSVTSLKGYFRVTLTALQQNPIPSQSSFCVPWMSPVVQETAVTIWPSLSICLRIYEPTWITDSSAQKVQPKNHTRTKCGNSESRSELL